LKVNRSLCDPEVLVEAGALMKVRLPYLARESRKKERNVRGACTISWRNLSGNQGREALCLAHVLPYTILAAVHDFLDHLQHLPRSSQELVA
jgi:hypothetical protein